MKYTLFVVGMFISIISVFYLVEQLREADFKIAISGFNLVYFVPCTFSLALAYVLRISRWSMLLSEGSKRIAFWGCVSPFMASIAINNVLPFRLGDVLRAIIFPKSMSIEPLVSTGTMIYEKLLDVSILLIFVFLYACVNLAILDLIIVKSGFTFTIISLAIIGVIFFKKFFLVANFTKILKSFDSALLRAFTEALLTMVKHVNYLSSGGIVLRMTMITVLSWLFEGGTYYFVLQGLNIDIGFLELLFITSATTFATLVPSSPGYVGTFHVAAFSVAMLIGIETTNAAAFAIISHLCVWLPTTLAGLVSVAFNPTMFYLAREYTSNEKQN